MPGQQAKPTTPAPHQQHQATAYGAPGQTDGTPEVPRFAETLEKVCIETVEEGKLTKDLATLVGPSQPHLTTQEFLAAIDAHLVKAMRA